MQRFATFGGRGETLNCAFYILKLRWCCHIISFCSVPINRNSYKPNLNWAKSAVSIPTIIGEHFKLNLDLIYPACAQGCLARMCARVFDPKTAISCRRKKFNVSKTRVLSVYMAYYICYVVKVSEVFQFDRSSMIHT